MESLAKNKFLRFGLPLIVLTIGGSLGIKEFASWRIEAREARQHTMSGKEIDEMTGRKRRTFDMNTEYARLNEKMNIDQWENKRLPRPLPRPAESTKDL
eukprot:m.135499 g.135499  ORF g.135499 m.135499 type:complete len:99 (-) comp29799_c2_seq1:4724-5020(-)